jgi:hypothetical protein
MMALCPNCHDAATKGAITDGTQRSLKKNPYNKQLGYTSGALMVNQDYCAVRSGGVLLLNEGPVITVDGEQLLALKAGPAGELLLSATIYGRDGDLLASIVDNEWHSGEAQVWDLRADHQKLYLRLAERQVALNVNAQGKPVSLQAKLWKNGHLIDLRPAGIRVNGITIGSTGIADMGLVGLGLKLETSSCELELSRQHSGGYLVTAPDPVRRLVASICAWRRIRNA